MNSKESSTGDWTWQRGLLRAVLWAGLFALVTAGGLGLLARHYPLLTVNAWLRLGLGFMVPCVLFGVVHRTAGMAGSVCTALVVLLTAAIFVSQHYVFAWYGVPMASGRVLNGPVWLTLEAIMLTNSTAAIGLIASVALCHDGGSIWRAVLGVLSIHIHG
jgi:hypothetical protein